MPVKSGGRSMSTTGPLMLDEQTSVGAAGRAAAGHIRTHAANARPFFSVLAFPRFVREPLELDHKWMPHLTLRHYQACGILSRRNPPLSACTSGTKERPSPLLMIER